MEPARTGETYQDVEGAGNAAVTAEQVLARVAGLVPEVILEVMMDDGTRLVVLHDPLGPAGDDAPGAIRQAPSPERTVASDRIELEVTNSSTRVVRVSSHYPFELVNRRLEFDRARATGRRLDIDAGSTERWAPGETRTIGLVKLG